MDHIFAEVDVIRGFPHVGTPRPIQAPAPALRYNLYTTPHKALRLGLSTTLSAMGRIDPNDDAAVANLAGEVRALLKFCHAHLEKEEQFIHPAMESRRPGSSTGTREDHRDHLAEFVRLESAAQGIETAKGQQREQAVNQLYHQLALFMADNLVHMHVEETDNNAVLWAAYSDDELEALEQRLVASIPPETRQLALRWMVPALNPAERASFFQDMKAHLPAAAFAAISASARPLLTEAEWRKLNLELMH